MEPDRRIEDLLAKQEITEQIYRYCRAMDRIDDALGQSVWHADGLADYGAIFNGTGAGFVEWVRGNHLGLVCHSHQVSNILIEVDGDTAWSEAYVTVALREERRGSLFEITNRGRYIDRWSRRDARWAIAHRRYAHDFSDSRPITTDLMPGWGRRDRLDLSYARD